MKGLDKTYIDLRLHYDHTPLAAAIAAAITESDRQPPSSPARRNGDLTSFFAREFI
jgi:hypothetical protein